MARAWVGWRVVQVRIADMKFSTDWVWTNGIITIVFIVVFIRLFHLFRGTWKQTISKH